MFSLHIELLINKYTHVYIIIYIYMYVCRRFCYNQTRMSDKVSFRLRTRLPYRYGKTNLTTLNLRSVGICIIIMFRYRGLCHHNHFNQFSVAVLFFPILYSFGVVFAMRWMCVCVSLPLFALPNHT